MFNKEKALEIVTELGVSLVLKASEKTEFFENNIYRKYYYASESIKEGHIQQMKEFGWTFIEDKKREGVYYKNLNDKENIYVYCGHFVKSIDKLFYTASYSDPFMPNEPM